MAQRSVTTTPVPLSSFPERAVLQNTSGADLYVIDAQTDPVTGGRLFAVGMELDLSGLQGGSRGPTGYIRTATGTADVRY